MELFHHRDLAGTCGCHGDDFLAEGCNEPLRRLDAIMSSEFEAKLLGRVGPSRDQVPEAHDALARGGSELQVGVAEPGTSRNWRSCQGTQATEQ